MYGHATIWYVFKQALSCYRGIVVLDVLYFLMYPDLEMRVPLLANKKCYTHFFTTLLLAYLLVFSCFALYHAYSENEILNAHECAIGLWIQHGQAALTFFVALVLFLSIVSRKFTFHTQLWVQSHFFQYIPRGPPFQRIAF